MPIFYGCLYKHNVVAEIKMGAYIHGCLFCVGAYYPDFTVCLLHPKGLVLYHDHIETYRAMTCYINAWWAWQATLEHS